MKGTLFALGMCFVALLAVSCGMGGDGAGDPSPPFTFEAFGNSTYDAGETVTLDTFSDTPVVLNFWYPSCPPCRLEMPHFEAAFRSHAGRVMFVGIQQLGLDSAEQGQLFVDEFELSFAIGPDATGETVREFNVITFPTTLFLDAQHRIVRRWAGPLNEEKLNELIQEISPAS